MANLQRVLRCFQVVSGLKVKLVKSMVMGVGCSEEIIQSLADVFGQVSNFVFGVAGWGES